MVCLAQSRMRVGMKRLIETSLTVYRDRQLGLSNVLYRIPSLYVAALVCSACMKLENGGIVTNVMMTVWQVKSDLRSRHSLSLPFSRRSRRD